MRLRRLKLSNFRNIQDGAIEFPPGVSIIVGANGAGKTSLLEAAMFACCGRSFRTRREQEMVQEKATFFRVEALVDWNGSQLGRAVACERGSGAVIDSGGGPQWLPGGSTLCFSPDDLQLIKGPPAERRRFLDDAIGRQLPSYRRLLLDYQKVMAQRNSFLQRARAGLVQLADISPWDRQLASLAVRIYRSRSDHCREIAPRFEESFREISSDDARTDVRYVSQLEHLESGTDLEEKMVLALAERWSEDLGRLSTGFGTHRDDVDFTLASRSLRAYGSQGEQRAAVLALLLADRRMGIESGEPPLLLLDDVMSELDPERRRRLLNALAGNLDRGSSGYRPSSENNSPQTIITAADAGLFTDEELDGACVIEVASGALREARAAMDG
ncbi:MAG: DNA replication and repair protein RecF [Thermoleophilia bacterium]|nr:DNA replication and repair protein RecF [Thermoleophilia bacterium]